MKIEKYRLCLFIAVAVLQLALPLYMVWHWENVLSTGKQYYWQTAPIDPYDALRGRYVRLSFGETKGAIADNKNLEHGQSAFAAIYVDSNGYAHISQISDSKPTSGEYLKVKVQFIKDNEAYIELPFNRFYMREDLAPLAQSAYLKNSGQKGWAAVRIKDGMGVIEELYIGDKTITEYLRENLK